MQYRDIPIKHRVVLEFIRGYVATHWNYPTPSQISSSLGKKPLAVTNMIRDLRAYGLLEWYPEKGESIADYRLVKDLPYSYKERVMNYLKEQMKHGDEMAMCLYIQGCDVK